MKKCIRCGYCCMSGLCSEGIESKKTGLCTFLIIHEDLTTSCSHVLNGKGENITVGKGCVLQEAPDSYEYCKEMYYSEKQRFAKQHNL